MRASRKRTTRQTIQSSSGSSLRSLSRLAVRLSYTQRGLSRAERRSRQSTLTSILEHAIAIEELRTMWENGILPTITSTEYAELLRAFQLG